VCIFAILNDFSLSLMQNDISPVQRDFVQCPAPVVCGQGETLFDLEFIQNLSGHAVVLLLLDIDMDHFVPSQLGLNLDVVVKHLLVLCSSILSRGNLTCSVDMVVMVKSRLSPQHAQLLQSVGWNFVVVGLIDSPVNVLNVLKGHHFRSLFTKLQIFNMTAYDAIRDPVWHRTGTIRDQLFSPVAVLQCRTTVDACDILATTGKGPCRAWLTWQVILLS
jgi:hypothetical protein